MIEINVQVTTAAGAVAGPAARAAANQKQRMDAMAAYEVNYQSVPTIEDSYNNRVSSNI